jgi:hypothetical protein
MDISSYLQRWLPTQPLLVALLFCSMLGLDVCVLLALTANTVKLGRIPGYNDDASALLSEALTPSVVNKMPTCSKDH